MPPQEIAFAAPTTEEMTRGVVGAGTGLVTGLGVGMLAKIAPEFGVVSPILTWGGLLVAPVVGLFGALFTKGILSDAFFGMAAGGAGALGYTLPGLLPELGLARGQLTAEQRAALAAGQNVKQLPPGVQFAPQRQQAMAALLQI
ncbi:hypothetical protein ES706_04879 [subsurface metagenome]